MRKQLIALLLAIEVICTLTGCGAKSQAATRPPQETPPPVEESLPEPEPMSELPLEPDGVNPLTGLPIDEAYENKRPVAVMLNNLKAAQPQLGVAQADIIYEIPAEGGITRMVGVFQSLDGVGTLGSIRSTRPYYLEVALGHDALLVHAGGSPEAYRDIPAWDVDNMDGVRGGSDADIFWRDVERKKTAGYEHSLLTSGEAVLEYLAEGHYRTEHNDGYTYIQEFAEDGTPTDGLPAEHVVVNISKYKKAGTFDYDANSGKYLVGQYGKPYIDGNTEEQQGFTNVLILDTAIYGIKGDTEGRQAVKLTGEGEGTYFCGGKAIPIYWRKQDRNHQFTYTYENGSPLTLGKGTSYVCIISPKMSSVTYQ